MLTPLVTVGKDYQIKRVKVRYLEPDLLQTTAIKQGTFSKPTLFGDEPAQPKWTKDFALLPAKQRPASETAQIRLSELGPRTPAASPRPRRLPGPLWEPVLKFRGPARTRRGPA